MLNVQLKSLGMKKRVIVVFGLVYSCCIQAQMTDPTVVASSGGTYQGASMQLDWTLGEFAMTTIGHSTGQLTQGFHQPSYLITSIHEFTNDVGQITVFPNPTVGQLRMKLKFDKERNIRIELFQLDGRVLWLETFKGYQIEKMKDLGHLPNASYLLRFSVDEDQYFRTFIIQKLN